MSDTPVTDAGPLRELIDDKMKEIEKEHAEIIAAMKGDEP
jgi:hypothetical protein